MSRKNKKSSAAGNYALCITIGLIIGVGLIPMVGNFAITIPLGGVCGALAAYLFNKKREAATHRHK